MRSLVLSAAFLALLSVLGCTTASPYSSTPGPVSGKVVSASGEPIRGGAEIILTPKAKEKGIFGKEGSAILNSDGTFSLKAAEGEEGIPGGYYSVVVRPYGAKNSTEKQNAMRAIPKKYWSEDTSDLTIEITGSKTDWEVKLAK